jgi:hypothetical protein
MFHPNLNFNKKLESDPTPIKEPIRAKPRRKPKIRAASQAQWVYRASEVPLTVTAAPWSYDALR